METLLHELALESVLIILFLTRWVIEWWATGRMNKRTNANNEALIDESRQDRQQVKDRLTAMEKLLKGDE